MRVIALCVEDERGARKYRDNGSDTREGEGPSGEMAPGPDHIFPDDPDDAQEPEGSQKWDCDDDEIEHVCPDEATTICGQVEAGEVVDRKDHPDEDVGDQEGCLFSGRQLNRQGDQQDGEKDQSERYKNVIGVVLPGVITAACSIVRQPPHRREM